MALENWQDSYTPEQVAHIIKCRWKKPPEQCIGTCNLEYGMFEDGCKSCGWCSDDIVVDSQDHYGINS